MKRPPVLVTKPATLPVAVEDARDYARIDDAVSDTRISHMIETATAGFDGYSGMLGRALITQTWRQDFGYGCGPFRLPFPDVQQATAALRCDDGVETTVALTLDEDVLSPLIRVASPGLGYGRPVLRVTFVAGYGDNADDVPAPIREAILMRVGQMVTQGSEDGQLRSFAIDGAFTEAYNSPEMRAGEVDASIRALVKPYRRGNVL